MPDAVEPVRHDMDQETTDELGRGKAHAPIENVARCSNGSNAKAAPQC